MLSIYAVIRSYAWDTMGRQLYAKSGSSVYYQITDPHGDNVAWASATALVGIEHFDPWGQLTYTPTGTTTPFGFQGAAGSWTDATTSFVSMGVRWYYPRVSEFLSSDPAAGTANPRTPIDRMRWLYAANDPVENSDPTGLMHVDAPADNCDSACMANVAAMEAQQAADARENRQHQIAQHSRGNIQTAPIDPGAGSSWLVINGYDVGQHVGNAWNHFSNDQINPDRSQLTWANFGTAAVGWADEGAGSVADIGCTASGIDVCAFVDTSDLRHHLVSSAVNHLGGHVDTNSDAYNDGRIAFVVGSTVAGGRGAVNLARGGLALLRGGAEVAEVTEPALAGGPRELDGGSLGDDLAACPVNSFAGGTKVLVADGSLKPIAEVRIGDKLRSIDPTTGRVVIGVVTGTYRNQDHEFADLTLIGLDGQTRHLLTTQHHRFWDETRQGWVFAVDLAHGDQLEEADGSLVKLWDVVVSRGTSMMYDLTVDSTHTFYVLAGSASILVHNCGGSEITFSESQLAAKSKHATDFGAKSQKPEDFLSAMSDHLDSPTAQRIQGWYGRSSNRIQAVHYYDPATRLNIITDTNGAFISGWRLGEVQAASLEMTGGFW